MYNRHVQPHDVFPVVQLELPAVVMDYLLMRLEMTVDDGVRVRNVGLVGVQWRHARSEDQEGHCEHRCRRPSNLPKHTVIMWAALRRRQRKTRSDGISSGG